MKSVFLTMVEKRTFRDVTKDGVFYRQEFRSGRECECLEFDSRQVIARKSPIAECRIVSQQYGGVRHDAPDEKLGVQKFENLL